MDMDLDSALRRLAEQPLHPRLAELEGDVMRLIAAEVRYQRTRSARLNCTGPGTKPPGRRPFWSIFCSARTWVGETSRHRKTELVKSVDIESFSFSGVREKSLSG